LQSFDEIFSRYFGRVYKFALRLTRSTDMAEDMTIPFMTVNGPWNAGSTFDSVNIKDIAPTVAKLLEVPANEDWEGTSLI